MKKNKKTEEQLLFEKTAKIYQSITRGSMDGFWIVDMQGRFLDVNDAYCNLLGYGRNELLKMKLADVAAGDKQQDVLKQLQKIKKNKEGRFLTRHKKKDGSLVDIEASANYGDYLGGLVYVFVRDISERKKIETDLAQHHIKSKKIIQRQLAESYGHLGAINRKISLLLELGRYPKSIKDKQEMMDHILKLAMNISKAPTGYLYGSKGKGQFMLLSHKGIKKVQKDKIQLITSQTVGLLRHLLKEKNSIRGDIKQYEADLLALDNKLEYFVTLPLEKGSGLGGFIFLGFSKKTVVDVQDLEFLDVFAMHASHALNKAGVLE